MVVAVLTQILHIRVDQASKHDLVLNILSIMRYEKYSFWSAAFWLLMWFRLIKFKWAIFLSDIWLRTILIVRMETRCRHKGYSFRLTTRFFLYAPSHRQDSTYHGLCYTSRGALAGTRNSSWRIDPTTHRTMSEHSYHGATSRCYVLKSIFSSNNNALVHFVAVKRIRDYTNTYTRL